MSQSNALEVEGLVRTLPLAGRSIEILRGIDFTIERGRWVAVTGASGSGKSTLLGMLSGLDRPTAGRVRLDGQDIGAMDEGRLSRIRNSKIGIVFQSFQLIGTLSAQENVELPLYVGPHRRDAERRAALLLDMVGLRDRASHRPHQLSGGEQQRVAIARALVADPTLVVADEPTGNLDSRNSAQILDLFARLHRELGLTLVIVTHDATVAARAEQRLHLVDGRLAAA